MPMFFFRPCTFFLFADVVYLANDVVSSKHKLRALFKVKQKHKPGGILYLAFDEGKCSLEDSFPPIEFQR